MSFLDRLLGKSDPRRETARELADSIIAAARRPELYLSGYAEDDFEGRFGMVALHGALVMRRLKTLSDDGLVISEKLGEALFDRFDYAYREEGVGDASIARKVRKLGERYFGLARALDAALDTDRTNVTQVLHRNGLGERDRDGLTQLVAETDCYLQALSEADIRAVRVIWPDV